MLSTFFVSIIFLFLAKCLTANQCGADAGNTTEMIWHSERWTMNGAEIPLGIQFRYLRWMFIAQRFPPLEYVLIRISKLALVRQHYAIWHCTSVKTKDLWLISWYIMNESQSGSVCVVVVVVEWWCSSVSNQEVTWVVQSIDAAITLLCKTTQNEKVDTIHHHS